MKTRRAVPVSGPFARELPSASAPAALNIAAVLIIAILLLASFGLTRGSFRCLPVLWRERSLPQKMSATSRALSCLIFAFPGC